jgi:hypothetical protein
MTGIGHVQQDRQNGGFYHSNHRLCLQMYTLPIRVVLTPYEVVPSQLSPNES